MDLDDLAPARGGSLRDGTHRVGRQTVGTFTETRTVHPDQIWNPRGGELTGSRPWRSDSEADHRGPERTRRVSHHEQAARTVRAALRSGSKSGRRRAPEKVGQAAQFDHGVNVVLVFKHDPRNLIGGQRAAGQVQRHHPAAHRSDADASV
jgi:hypothetical protein